MQNEVSTPRLTTRLDALVQAQQARGIVWASIGRLLYVVAGATLVGIVHQSLGQLALAGSLAVIGVALSVRSLQVARRGAHLGWFALGGAVFDVVVIASSPWTWRLGDAAAGGNLVAQSPFQYLVFLTLALNALTLRPLLPVVVALAAATQQLLLTGLGGTEVALRLGAPAEGIATAGAIWSAATILLVGLALAVLARGVRRLARDGARADQESAQELDQQFEAEAGSRLAQLAQEVSQQAHELRAPLRLITLGLSNSRVCAQGLVQSVERSPADDLRTPGGIFHRNVDALNDGLRMSEGAVARLGELIASLEKLPEQQPGNGGTAPSAVLPQPTREPELQAPPAA